MFRWPRILWYVLTLRCEEAERVRALEREGGATRSQRVAERVHRGLCRSCRHARAQVERLEEALGDLRRGAEEPLAASGRTMPEASKERLRRLARGGEENS
jgi:hypothetical protein